MSISVVVLSIFCTGIFFLAEFFAWGSVGFVCLRVLLLGGRRGVYHAGLMQRALEKAFVSGILLSTLLFWCVLLQARSRKFCRLWASHPDPIHFRVSRRRRRRSIELCLRALRDWSCPSWGHCRILPLFSLLRGSILAIPLSWTSAVLFYSLCWALRCVFLCISSRRGNG